jgi:hypothetical protein
MILVLFNPGKIREVQKCGSCWGLGVAELIRVIWCRSYDDMDKFGEITIDLGIL